MPSNVRWSGVCDNQGWRLVGKMPINQRNFMVHYFLRQGKLLHCYRRSQIFHDIWILFVISKLVPVVLMRKSGQNYLTVLINYENESWKIMFARLQKCYNLLQGSLYYWQNTVWRTKTKVNRIQTCWKKVVTWYCRW